MGREHLLLEHRVIKKRPSKVGVEQHLCLYCGKKFTSTSYLRQHVKHVHGENKDTFSCHVCGKRFVTKTALEVHGALHVAPTLPCPDCNKLFHTRTYLMNHIKTK